MVYNKIFHRFRGKLRLFFLSRAQSLTNAFIQHYAHHADVLLR